MTATCKEDVNMDVLQAMRRLVTRRGIDTSALGFCLYVYILICVHMTGPQLSGAGEQKKKSMLSSSGGAREVARTRAGGRAGLRSLGL